MEELRNEMLETMSKVIDEQIKRLDELRANVAAADDSLMFTKEAYLDVLDAYIDCEKRHHDCYRKLRELGAI